VGHDGNIYGPSNGRLIKISPSGEVLDSTDVISQGDFFILKATAAANGNIYLTGGQDSVFAFTSDLQRIWSDFIQNNNTSGAAIASGGELIVAGMNYIHVYAPSDSLVGTVETREETSMKIYPNPAHDFATLTVPSAFIHQPYELTDAQGRTIEKGVIQNTNTPINLSQIRQGRYQIQLPKKKATIPLIKG